LGEPTKSAVALIFLGISALFFFFTVTHHLYYLFVFGAAQRLPSFLGLPTRRETTAHCSREDAGNMQTRQFVYKASTSLIKPAHETLAP
jgi:hypothetical protein